MKRGDLITITAKGEYTQKPRPALVIQSDLFLDSDSVTIIPLTTKLQEVEATKIRPRIYPTKENGLQTISELMIDKIITIPRVKTGQVFGTMEKEMMVEIRRLLILWLGIAER